MMHRTLPHGRSSRLLLAVILSGMLLGSGGCGLIFGGGSKNQSNIRPNNASSSVDTQRPANDFETRTKDPALTAQTHFAAGQLAETQHAPQRAIEQYRKALTKEPNHVPTLYRLGILHSKLHQHQEAISVWTKYVKAAGGTPAAYANLGFAYELAGRITDAENAYLKGIKLDPKDPPCRVNYGLMLARNNRINEATLQLQTVLPQAQVHYNIASVYEWMGRKEQARIEYRKALDLDPQMKEAEARLASLE